MASALPESIAIAINIDKGECYVCRNEIRGLVRGGSEGLLSPLVKIQVEPAEVDDDHVHLRFTHSNRYWQKREGNSDIVAVSTRPDEDKENLTCTLFKPRVESDVLYLTHAQTGRPVVFDQSRGFLSLDRNGTGSPMRFVDADTLVKLPKHVAFKAVYNGFFLKAEYYRDYTLFSNPVDYRYFRFNSSDRDEVASRYEVIPMEDGHVMIKSEYYGMFWVQTKSWIAGGSNDVATPSNKYALFRPVKISDNAIALRSAANDMFCKGLTLDNKYDCLNANDPNMSKYAQLEVHELVKKRIISNVMYRMDDTRIYDEKPLMVGQVSLENPSDQEETMTAEVEYKDEKSYSFSHGLSITTGVIYSMDLTNLLFISGKGKVRFLYDLCRYVNWGHTKMEATTLTASDTVTVPPKSKVIVNCVATEGTCNVPFSYTQDDFSSIDNNFSRSDHVDGVYEGVSYFNIKFEVAETHGV
ncbi:uncharacterized protein LOC125199983 [Salvia hispanica]|uniref:uncharacterized protein LOC125199983 n=1 Tax=Salvia hispanica TaxID=49212 RepID=UPI0020098873|nr:uncharacterized protein LOC125199983 [Salvia hispanica]